jgi:hypothetical protein
LTHLISKRLRTIALITFFIVMTISLGVVPKANAQSALSTTYNSNSSGRTGFYFDVHAINAVTVTGFATNVIGGLSVTVSVYYRTSSSTPAKGNPAGWNLLGTRTITSVGTNTPTAVNIGGPTIPAGATYGFYFFYSNLAALYTNGTGTYSNADLNITITSGAACNDSAPFQNNGPADRIWNGTVFYSSGTGSAKFFDPGDNRVDPRPGDRVAVYCVLPDELRVIVISDAGRGVGYTRFKLADLTSAGKPGLWLPPLTYVTNQPANLGTVSVQLVRSPGLANFYVAWNGGQYQATGQGDFHKQFSSPNFYCNFQ